MAVVTGLQSEFSLEPEQLNYRLHVEPMQMRTSVTQKTIRYNVFSRKHFCPNYL